MRNAFAYTWPVCSPYNSSRNIFTFGRGISPSRGNLKKSILCRHKIVNPPEGLKTLSRENLQNPSNFFLTLHSSGTQPCRKLWRENVIHPIRGLVLFWLQRGFGIIFTKECFRKYIPRQLFCQNTSKGFFAKLTPQKVNARNPSIIYLSIS